MAKKRNYLHLYVLAVAGLAIVLTAANGTTDWMALLVFLAFAHPRFRKYAYEFVKGKPHVCSSEKPDRDA